MFKEISALVVSFFSLVHQQWTLPIVHIVNELWFNSLSSELASGNFPVAKRLRGLLIELVGKALTNPKLRGSSYGGDTYTGGKRISNFQ